MSKFFTGTYFGKVGKDISHCNGDLRCALDSSGLGFDVQLEPVNDMRGNVIPRKFNVARVDNGESVGLMGAKYTPTQTRNAFKYLEALPGKANFRRGGLMKEGRFFLSAEFDTFTASGDTLTAFGVFLSSFDGSWGNRIVWVLGRHSCLNICRFMHETNADGIGKGRAGRIAKHTANHAEKLDGFLFELQMAQETTAQTIGQLSNAPISRDAFAKIVEKVVPGEGTRSDNMRSEITSYFTRSDLAIHGETRWDAFNAFSAYDTHSATRRETATATAEENALDCLLSGRAFADKALPLLMALERAPSRVQGFSLTP